MAKTSFDMGAESGEDIIASVAATEHRLGILNKEINELAISSNTDQIKLATLKKEVAWALLDLKQGKAAWLKARPLFDIFFSNKKWPETIEICEILFQSNQIDSLTALGQAVWLSVTFPMNPQVTISMLQYVIDETADDSDGAAVAAATAVYIYDLRKELSDNSDLYLDAMQMLTSVGRRHSNTHDQEAFDAWIKKMELNNPQKFLVRLRNVIDVLVQDQWWFDRDAVQAELPIS